jgi:hypothetical protein
MVEGPYSSQRWRHRVASVEGVLLILGGIASVIYLVVAGYELVTAGAYLKLGITVGLAVILLPLVMRLKMPFALLVLAALGVAIGFVHAYFN